MKTILRFGTVRSARNLQTRRGATLLEVVISIVIFGLAVGGMCGAVLHVMHTSYQARAHYTAANIAANQIEEARRLDFLLIHGLAEEGTVVDQSGVADATGRYRRTTVVSNISSMVTLVTVEVQIEDRRSGLFGSERETVAARLANWQEGMR